MRETSFRDLAKWSVVNKRCAYATWLLHLFSDRRKQAFHDGAEDSANRGRAGAGTDRCHPLLRSYEFERL